MTVDVPNVVLIEGIKISLARLKFNKNYLEILACEQKKFRYHCSKT